MENPHFRTVADWAAAAEMLVFAPRVPSRTNGARLRSLAVHIRDHRMRDLGPEARSLEAHYGDFVLSQSWAGADARRRAIETPYGLGAREASLLGREARMYPPGSEPLPGDPDPVSPAVVVWHDAGVVCLVASERLDLETLTDIAGSLYAPGAGSSPASAPRG